MVVETQDQIEELRRELEFVRERESLLMQIDAVTHNATDPAEITYKAARLLRSEERRVGKECRP